jgi:hypothetical protein
LVDVIVHSEKRNKMAGNEEAMEALIFSSSSDEALER